MPPYSTLPLPAEWDTTDGLVSFTDITRTAPASYHQLWRAVHAGAVEPTEVRRGRGGAKTFTVEDALFLLGAAILAAALGAAVVTVAKSLRGTGAGVTSAGLTIPIRVSQ